MPGVIKRGTNDYGTRSREGEVGHQSPSQGNATIAPKVENVFTKLEWIAQKAHEDSTMVFTI